MQETNETLETTVKVESSSAERLEKERLTRRQALRKMGITTTLSVLALFTADDLARMASKALKQFAGDSKVANQVADEFMNAGAAFATSFPPGNCGPSSTAAEKEKCCSWGSVSTYCESKNTTTVGCISCVNGTYGSKGYCTAYAGPGGASGTGNEATANGSCHGKFDTSHVP